jgi:ubiquitin-activating enzyme E1
VILPFKTSSYGESQDQEQGEGIPMCTLRNFPHLIDHCIEWGRAQFTDLFESPVKDISALFETEEGKDGVDAFVASLEKEGTLTAKLTKLNAALAILSPFAGQQRPTFRTCTGIALRRLYEDHAKRIDELTASFPEDAISTDPDTGEQRPFWSGSKRFPRATRFDKDDEGIVGYLHAASNLYASIYNVPQVPSRAEFQKGLPYSEYAQLFAKWTAEDKERLMAKKASSLTKASDEEIEASLSDESQQKEFNEAIVKIKEIIASTKENLSLAALEFEKDDDSNFHVDFITACANARAWNYHIPLASRYQCKMIAGKIIPALATTTALITGLVSVEMIKLAMGMEKDQFDGANINLANNTYALFEPPSVIKAVPHYDEVEMCDIKPVPDGFTCWDKVVIKTSGLTVGQVVEQFPKFHHGVNVSMLLKANLTQNEASLGNSFLYTSFAPTKTMKEAVERYKNMLFKDAYAELYGEDVSKLEYAILDGAFEIDDEPVKIPTLKCYF